MCLLFESINITNGEVCNLPYNQLRAAKYSSIDLLSYINSNVNIPVAGTHKLRITHSESGIYDHTLELYTPKRVDSLKLITDNDIDYHKKSTDRRCFDNLMEHKGACDDILIIKNGVVSDISFANILFLDGERWITPDTPLLEGTCRARLIAQNIVTTRRVTPNDLGLFSKFMVVNSMLDFDPQRAVTYRFNEIDETLMIV